MNKAAQELGRLGGAVRSEKKAASSRANGAKGGRPRNWLVVVNYDCTLGQRGQTISRHATYEAARKAAKATGYDSFLGIKNATD